MNGSRPPPAGNLYAGFNVDDVDPHADDNITIRNVNVTSFLVGFWFTDTEGNKILGCNITENIDGIWFGGVHNSTISGNNIMNNSEGIEFQSYSSNNTISGNNITDNSGVGIFIHSGSDNKFYYNYFINNDKQASMPVGHANIWDDNDGRGNYWSNYLEEYPNATEIDGSGIWDTPYVIEEDNVDNYPIVPEFPSIIIIPLLMIATSMMIIACRKKQHLGP